MGVRKGQPILDFSNMMITFDVNLQPITKGNLILLIYSDNQIGSIEYNYFPVVFYDLVKNFIDVQNCLNKNFRIQFKHLTEKNKSNLMQKNLQAKMKFKEMFEH